MFDFILNGATNYSSFNVPHNVCIKNYKEQFVSLLFTFTVYNDSIQGKEISASKWNSYLLASFAPKRVKYFCFLPKWSVSFFKARSWPFCKIFGAMIFSWPSNRVLSGLKTNQALMALAQRYFSHFHLSKRRPKQLQLQHLGWIEQRKTNPSTINDQKLMFSTECVISDTLWYCFNKDRASAQVCQF